MVNNKELSGIKTPMINMLIPKKVVILYIYIHLYLKWSRFRSKGKYTIESVNQLAYCISKPNRYSRLTKEIKTQTKVRTHHHHPLSRISST